MSGIDQGLTRNGTGYAWRQDPDPDRGPVLVPNAPPAPRVWHLSDHPSLFRTFADLRPLANAVLGFANEHGLLEGTTDAGAGERLRVWRAAIYEIRQMISLWEACRSDDPAALAARIVWPPGRRAVEYRDAYPPPGLPAEPAEQVADLLVFGTQRLTVIASEDVLPERLERFAVGDLLAPALVYLGQQISERLRDRVGTEMAVSADGKRLSLAQRPMTLLAALWLQFATAVSEDKAYRRCKVCGRWLELSPEVARTNRLFCTDACRMKAYRGRQAEARRMHRDGVPVREIARRLEVEVATVKQWTAK